MTYEHFVYSPDVDTVAGAYQQAGYVVAVHDGLVLVYSDYTEDHRAVIQAITAEHGATYDGGGMYVGPLPHSTDN
ncbi:hypothetical protein [Mycolicibacterium fluoranthenivorans]|uniref:Uncharacterized protein n=1 Tax=Mycolicibacterium fluoranthenivorans TaxID=258505 RepID=A0A1G4WZG9_9MYCO|nr:hypothetical protein [Mycolicibacterium fluoranthenivorans]SCX32921.1 hypothetical protein SAMN02799620_05743 [Mycolicibacterium fluoranthenivorans]